MLSSFPETTDPAVYQHLLPKVATQQLPQSLYWLREHCPDFTNALAGASPAVHRWFTDATAVGCAHLEPTSAWLTHREWLPMIMPTLLLPLLQAYRQVTETLNSQKQRYAELTHTVVHRGSSVFGGVDPC